MIIMGSKREKLLKIVKKYHGDQERKYEGSPYWTHTLVVADMADHLNPFAWEIGVCHDLLEDTECDDQTLFDDLFKIGYGLGETKFIVSGVIDLTDVYEKVDFPSLNRRIRKEYESERLSKIPALSQSIKYCDMIHNSLSIIENDENFAVVYIREINETLKNMNKGDFKLYRTLCSHVQRGIDELGLHL